MVFYQEGDLLEITEGTIAHQVCSLGYMGAGLALQIQRRWPEVYAIYKADTPKLGEIQITQVSPTLWVANLCAQDSIGTNRRRTDYGALDKCLRTLRSEAHGRIYLPWRLGCGLGGGHWGRVRNMIFNRLPEAIILYRVEDGFISEEA